MFTPQSQRKGWAGWALSPRAGVEGAASARTGKGKAVAEETPPPPQRLLGEGVVGEAGGDAEVWKSFREAGFLDEASFQRREKEAMSRRIAELEKELHEYQYNMGLLLIEKKEWALKFEEIRHALEESEEILKREQSAHLIAISELEKREENTRKALGVEKQCVVELEKALREMRAEVAEIKFTSDKKLAEAHALEASLDEKYLEIQGKLHSADARLAEANRKNSEADRKLHDAEDRERKLERERLSLNTERKAHEKDLAKQRQHLRDWEKELQDGQKRLLEGQSFLNEREQRVNVLERDLSTKAKELDVVKKDIECIRNSLKEKEDDISIRLRALSAKEKEADVRQMDLEKKEKDLYELEEKLNARERVEMQKLLDDHNETLNLKKQEFESELQEQRRSFDEEFKSKLDTIEKDKNEVKRKEEHILRREKTLDDKMEELKEKVRDIESISKALDKKEECLKDREKKLDEEKKQMARDHQELVNSKAELEGLKAAIEAKEKEIIAEEKKLEVTKEEREEHLLMQSQLKKEIEDYRLMKESVAKQIDDLREEREKFETEWEVLDEKRKGLEIELKQVNNEREKFETWRQSEEERLKNERHNARVDIERELEELRLKKEAFQDLMAHERSQVRETLERERADMTREFDIRKHELEINMQEKQEEMEKKLKEKEDEFNRRRELEINNIISSSSLNEMKAQKLKTVGERLEREKEGISASRRRLQADQLEIQQDIDTLRTLSRNLKDQRELLIKEREHFLVVAEQCKTCKNCGVAIGELELLGLEQLRAVEDAGNVLLPRVADGFLEENTKFRNPENSPQGTGSQSVASGGRMSWLRKCTSLFKISPGKRADHSPEDHDENITLFEKRLDREALEGQAEIGPEPSFGVDSFDTQRDQFDNAMQENEKSERFDKAENDPELSFGVADDAVDILGNMSDKHVREIQIEPVIPPTIEQNEKEASSLPPKSDSQSQASKERRRQPSRSGRRNVTKRTRSVKTVVEDAKKILGNASEENIDGHPNGDAKDMNIHEESLGDSVHTGQVAPTTRQRKRSAHASGMTASEIDAEDSEGRSESISVGGRRKRRQVTAPGAQAAGGRRYNFRRSTVANTSAATQAVSGRSKGHNEGSHHPSEANATLKTGGGGEGTSRHDPTDEPSSGCAGVDGKSAYLQQKNTVESILEIHEVSTQKLVQFKTVGDRTESIDNIVTKSVFSEQSAEDGEEVHTAEREATPTTPSGAESGSDDEDNYEDDEEENKQNASIGKKLWTFFTT